MSLQLSTRENGAPFFLYGSGAIPAGATYSSGMAMDSRAGIYAANSGTVFASLGGLSFDSDGRLLVSSEAVARYVNGLPVDSTGFLCVGGTSAETWSNGLPMAGDGTIAAWSPAYLFADGAEDGYFYPIPTLGTAPNYTTAAGSTLVTAYGDPMGRMEDTSGNGVDATQSTAGSRPTAGGFPFGGDVRNLLTYTEDISNAGWTPVGCTTPDFETLIPNNGTGLSFSGNYVRTTSTIAKSGVAQQWTMRAVVEAAGFNRAGILVSAAGGTTDRATIVVSLTDGSVIVEEVAGTFSSISSTTEDIGGGQFEISMTFTTGTETALSARMYARDSVATAGNGTDGIKVTKLQLEQGTATAYQKVTAPYLVTQSGLPTVPAAYFDLTDDSVSLTLPAGTYTIVIPGNRGTWIDEGFVWAGGTFTIGPTTYTNGPANLFSNVTGRWLMGGFAIDRALTASEKAQVGRYYKARGNAGVWELSAELFSGTITLGTGWSDNGGGSYTHASGTESVLATGNPVSAGELVRYNFTLSGNTSGVVQVVTNSTDAVSGTFGSNGTRSQIGVAAATGPLGIRATASSNGTVSDISLKRLTLNETP